MNFFYSCTGISQCGCKSSRKPILEAESYSKLDNSEIFNSETVSMADQRITSLSTEIKKLKEDLYLSNECVEMLKSEV